MPPARPDGDGPERQRDRQAARPPPEHDPARARPQPVRRRLQAGQRRAARLGAQAARLEDRALHPPSRPRRGPPCHGMVPGADRGADGARRIGAQGQRGVDLPPRLQPGRATGRAAAAARATQAEARPATAQRPARARHPQPHADPPAPDKGPSSQPVRPLGGRPHALPPPARHPPDAAGEALPADAGPSSSSAKTPTSPPKPSPGSWADCRPSAPHHHPRQRRRVRPARGRDRRHRPGAPTSATRTARGSAARSRTQTAGFAATFPARPPSRDYTDADIDDVIWNLNATPRKCLGYRTPDRGIRRQPRCRT